MPRNSENPALKRFTIFTAVSTLVLLCIGGLVTSHGAGMAVPDWPNTYGYNMFFFPVSQWVGGVLYEHSHRLVPFLFKMVGPVYLVGALILGIGFLWCAVRFARELTVSRARQLFFASIIYLPLLLVLMVLDKITN